jgi:hypothetical protein
MNKQFSKIYVFLDDKGLGFPVQTKYEFNQEEFKELNLRGYGVFQTVNSFNLTKPLAEDEKTYRCDSHLSKLDYVYSDIDIAKRNDGQTDEEKKIKKEAKLQEILLFNPTIVIETANGIQPYWAIKDGTVNTESKLKCENIIWSIICKFNGDPGAKDLSRILRLPDFYHNKGTPFLCKTIHKADAIYTLDELAAMFPFTSQANENIKNKTDFWEALKQGFPEGNRHSAFLSLCLSMLKGRPEKDWGNVALVMESTYLQNAKDTKGFSLQDAKVCFNQACKYAKKWEKDNQEPNLRREEFRNAVISYNDFLAKELPPSKWVVADIIPEGMTILSSAPGQFKTYLFLALAKQISNGELAFNHFNAEKRNILFINEEMGERMMQDRLKTINGEAGKMFFTNLAGVKLEDMSYILEFCKEKDISLVMFDSLTRIHRLKENDADDVKKIFESMLLLLKANISVVMTHHHRKTPMFGAKNGSEEMRGSIDILAQIDCHLAIDQVAIDKTYVVLKQLKIRIADNIEDFKIDIKKDKDDKMSFIYKGKFSKQDEVNAKVAQNSEIILEIIKESPGLNKDKIKEKVGGRVGQLAVDACLLDLEKKDIIFCKTKKPKTYYIKEEISSLF